jgi:tRNA dimethylallyltransferase
MDIGAAKPTAAELGRVPHHLIDICAPDEPMDIARYVGLARSAVEAIRQRNHKILVTGGSGFYLKAFFAPVTDAVAVPAAVRHEVGQLTVLEAVNRLRELNPAGLGRLDPANPRRVMRALERCLASGRTLVELQAAFARQPAPFADHDVKLVELLRTPADLATRIERRVAAMLAAGLVAEVRRLLTDGLRRNPSAAGAIGYREVIALLEERLPEAELAAAIGKNTRALVKKQRTWFRTQLPPHATVAAETATLEQLFAGG